MYCNWLLPKITLLKKHLPISELYLTPKSAVPYKEGSSVLHICADMLLTKQLPHLVALSHNLTIRSSALVLSLYVWAQLTYQPCESCGNYGWIYWRILQGISCQQQTLCTFPKDIRQTVTKKTSLLHGNEAIKIIHALCFYWKVASVCAGSGLTVFHLKARAPQMIEEEIVFKWINLDGLYWKIYVEEQLR